MERVANHIFLKMLFPGESNGETMKVIWALYKNSSSVFLCTKVLNTCRKVTKWQIVSISYFFPVVKLILSAARGQYHLPEGFINHNIALKKSVLFCLLYWKFHFYNRKRIWNGINLPFCHLFASVWTLLCIKISSTIFCRWLELLW